MLLGFLVGVLEIIVGFVFVYGAHKVYHEVFLPIWNFDPPKEGDKKNENKNKNKRKEKKDYSYKKIEDKYETVEDLQNGLRKSGLEQCNIIIGVDFTKSNMENGRRTFGGRCLHDLNIEVPNPYQQVIHLIGETLQSFDDDKIIPAFGFGDSTTTDIAVFNMNPEGDCKGFEEVLNSYNAIVPKVELSGPTSFAPLIYTAIDIVKRERSYHILIIICDGKVTSEPATRKAIVEASNYPLSIIAVGVGDGPWEQMKEFDDELPERKFDNFQFVQYNKVMNRHTENPKMAFRIKALMEVPQQYKACVKLGYLDRDPRDKKRRNVKQDLKSKGNDKTPRGRVSNKIFGKYDSANPWSYAFQ